MMDRNRDTCCCCGDMIESCPKYCCKSCKSFFCENYIEELDSLSEALPVHSQNTANAGSRMKMCELCVVLRKSSRNCCDKIYPSESPRGNPEPPSPSISGEGFGVNSPSPLTRGSDVPSSIHPPPVLVECPPCRSDDDDEGEDSSSSFFGVLNEYFNDNSELDSGVVSSRDVFYSFVSVEPAHSLKTGPHLHSGGDGLQKDKNSSSLHDSSHNQELFLPNKLAERIWDSNCPTQFRQENKKWFKPLNFETNSLIWFPPPPEGINGEFESHLCTDDDDDVGGSGQVCLPLADVDALVPMNDLDHKDPIKPLIQEHFRALVSQLLEAQHLGSTNDGEWLDVITTIAWKAAKYIKPDTSSGGSMDPCDYVKVKCVASGSPGESKLVKGIVCTKNIKHKRMISEYKNARLLILGGALEYQRVPNLLASVQTLLQQENDHLKTVVSKIEAHHPNVLVVEKTVSSCALEHLLKKEISLVLNVKRPLLEKIARCTGASITPSTDHISMARLGHCELFHLERVSEDHGSSNQLNRKPSKTLMYFEGCPRRLGCTIVLRGSTNEELKKVKHVVQYAVFAAHHLSLETSFLADEGASLPEIDLNPPSVILPKMDSCIKSADCEVSIGHKEEACISRNDPGSLDLLLELGLEESWSELGNSNHDYFPVPDELGYKREIFQECGDSHAIGLGAGKPGYSNPATKESIYLRENHISEVEDSSSIKDDDAEQCLPNDNHHSILVSFSSHCMVNGTTCERTRLLRVKFYGPSDKPLGRYLRDDLFNQAFLCKSCNEPTESHVICYTHQNANLTIKVRHLLSFKLPGEKDGKIWMWHRCLQCELVEGVPPATGRVVMSDAAWGLSFAKFLELSFYNHITGNRVATCGHSLQRDCLRFYGFGSMIASFQYSHIDILSVYLPPPILEFNHPEEQRCIKKEAYELFGKVEALIMEVSSILKAFQIKSLVGLDGFPDNDELHGRFSELNKMLVKDKIYFKDLQQLINEDIGRLDQSASEEISNLRHSLLMCSQSWDCRLHVLEDIINRTISSESPSEYQDACSVSCPGNVVEINDADKPNASSFPSEYVEEGEKICSKDVENAFKSNTSLVRRPSAASILSDHIDSAWSGVYPSLTKDDDCLEDPCTFSSRLTNQGESPSIRRLKGTTRVYSFDSSQRNQERIRKGLPPSSLYLNTLRSFHASGEYRKMIRDPVGTLGSPELSPCASGKLGLSTSALFIPEGRASLMTPQNGLEDVVSLDLVKDPTSIIAYALSSKEYDNRILFKPLSGVLNKKSNTLAPGLSSWRSSGSIDPDLVKHRSFSFEDHNRSPHLQISFEDEACKTTGKVKFSVTCYFAREFDELRRKCCPSEMDFIRSLSRCRKWGAQGGKSNVYFAKSMDERLVIKQVTKTELECFEEFGPDYFKYMSETFNSGSPTCLAKVLGMYQVTVRQVKGGKEMKKMDLMVMENLFYKRNISKVYDLKGSLRSRYISDTQGRGKVLLDMNLLETVGRNPIFVGSKAKRSLERAVWNDTSFLASVDVMDYSLLVGVDEERKELVMGIIDFMRQYTWDKQLETWVKASGILGGGGPKNASPTIVSPKQYKKRFRKAMTSYFLTVPDQWSS